MRSRLFYIALSLAMGAIGLGAALALNGVADIRGDLEASNTDRTELRSDLAKQKEASTALAEQVKRLGGKPVVDPPATNVPGPPGPAPTATQVNAAVADYCAGDRCKPVVSRAQVSKAVADYCANGRCRGKDAFSVDGKDGDDGSDGKDGEPGPGPTAEQIGQAVADYCADSKCAAKDGTDGKDGTSITEIACDRGTGSFVFTFSDGSTRTVECSPVG